MVYLLILLYFVFLVLLYGFILKRLRSLSYKHMNETWLKALWKGFEIIRRRLMIVFLILFFLSIFLILTFFDHGLFFKIWLYDNKETLNPYAF